ncbi:hypothetical protein PCANC_23882 [Puccinia coronata f. sp. avenae]|uniref:Uncharacterized protein n=1 Tax=Puccinia coronata f. sp. avenae TaxID=200324 RepID=A0A2N5TZ74_9BASI|nr:hypothetical protein PCANC_23882 [Puccinia coronata f. sp. avenae]
MRFGSACKYLYYISHLHGILVVKHAVQPLPETKLSNALLPAALSPIGVRVHIDLTKDDTNGSSVSTQEDDSDIEVVKLTLPTGKVIDAYRPPQRIKQALEEPTLPKHPAPKKPRTANTQANHHCKHPLSTNTPTQQTPLQHPMSSIGLSQQAPLASGSCVRLPTLHATTGSPSTPESGPPSNPRSKNSPQELFCLKHNSLASAMGALRQITAALRLVKGQKEMATKATLKQLTNFVCESHSLVRMMKGSPLGLESSPLPELAWASTVNGPEERTDQSQNLALVNKGWDYCKLTWNLLNDPQAKHKAQFCANLSLVFLDLFRE